MLVYLPLKWCGKSKKSIDFFKNSILLGTLSIRTQQYHLFFKPSQSGLFIQSVFFLSLSKQSPK